MKAGLAGAANTCGVQDNPDSHCDHDTRTQGEVQHSYSLSTEKKLSTHSWHGSKWMLNILEGALDSDTHPRQAHNSSMGSHGRYGLKRCAQRTELKKQMMDRSQRRVRSKNHSGACDNYQWVGKGCLAQCHHPLSRDSRTLVT